jgi:hypothetical protein
MPGSRWSMHHAVPAPCVGADAFPCRFGCLPLLLQVNKGQLWDSSQVDEGLPEVWVDLNRD